MASRQHTPDVEAFERQGYVDEPWGIHAHRQAKASDRVWLLRQGDGPKGIFGKGTITGLAALGVAGNGKQQMMVPVRFSAFIDPEQRLLVNEEQTRAILSETQIRARASGYPLTCEQSAALVQLVRDNSEHASLVRPEQADEAPFNPENITDARERIFAIDYAETRPKGLSRCPARSLRRPVRHNWL